MRACIFCQEIGPLTKEHVWPAWMKRYLPTDRIVRRVDTHARYGTNGFVRLTPRSGDYSSMKLKVVCAACNNGWMSDMQTSAMPAVRELLGGGQIDLIATRHTLANWCTMFAFVLEQGNPLSVTTAPALRRQFFERRTPPEAWSILVGRTPEQLGLLRQSFTRKAYADHYWPFDREWMLFCTVISGRFIFQVLGCQAWSDRRQRQLEHYCRETNFALLHAPVPHESAEIEQCVPLGDARLHAIALGDAIADRSDKHGPETHFWWPNVGPVVAEEL